MTIITLTPVQFSQHIKEATIKSRFYPTAAGILKVNSTEKGIIEASFVDELPSNQVCLPLPINDEPLILTGTDFQINVWKAALMIPTGFTTHYQALAASLGMPRACRAVANALGSNAISYLIPCHRIIGKNGSLTGYAWGVDRKKQLLAAERSLAEHDEPKS